MPAGLGELRQTGLRLDTTNPPGDEPACIEWLELFAKHGVQTDGFLPMQLPPQLRLLQFLHAADERLPADAVQFGTEAIRAVLERYAR